MHPCTANAGGKRQCTGERRTRFGVGRLGPRLGRPGAPNVVSLLLVLRPGASSSVLLLIAMPGAPSRLSPNHVVSCCCFGAHLFAKSNANSPGVCMFLRGRRLFPGVALCPSSRGSNWEVSLFFPKALRRVLPENPLNTDTSTLTLTH